MMCVLRAGSRYAVALLIILLPIRQVGCCCNWLWGSDDEQVGYASWYGEKYHGRKTANGETYNMYALTAAHRTLPLGTVVRVTNLENGKSVIVRINDRGPFKDPGKRIIDLSYAAAKKIGAVEKGVVKVKIVVIKKPDE